MENGPVFIVGMNGSGTTMLADCLGNHPELYIFTRETRILPHYIKNLHLYGSLENIENRYQLAIELGKCYPFWRVNNQKPVVLKKNDLTEPGFAAVVDKLFKFFALKQNKKRWGEKTPMYLQHVKLLSDTFPSAKFVHIYRDPRDVARSFQRRFNKNPFHTVYRWKKIISSGRRQGVSIEPQRFFEVGYEALTQEPTKWMKQICDFLCLEYSDAMLKSSMREMDPRIKTETIVRNSGKWKNHFTQKQIIVMESIGGKCMKSLGYELISKAGDYDPPKKRLQYWKIRDAIAAFTYTAKLYRGSALKLFLDAKSALIQLRTNRF